MPKSYTPIHWVQRSVLAFLTANSICYAASPNHSARQEPLPLDVSSTLLVMGRDYGNGLKGTSASVSLNASAKSELTDSLRYGIKAVHVQNLFEENMENAGYWLSNDTSSEVTEAYLSYNSTSGLLKRTELTLGRKEANYSFFPNYQVRHQAQALEGIFIETFITNRVSFDMGHIERYSSWPSRENGSSKLDSTFKKLGERLGYTQATSGIQFVSAKWSDSGYDLSAYDYYASELYNNAALKVAYNLPSSDNETKWTLCAHAINQKGLSGGYMPSHSANSLELNLRYKKDSLSIDTGWTHISNRGSLRVPFRTSYVNDATLLWYTNQFEAGTETFHTKAVYSHNPWTLAAVFLHAIHQDKRNEGELDLVAKRKLTEKLSACVKAGYGTRSFDDERKSQTATDLRLFVDYAY